MIEMRWVEYEHDYGDGTASLKKKLQYRTRDVDIEYDKLVVSSFRWTDWMDVPTVAQFNTNIKENQK